MKILFLVPYPIKESPSQRFRFEQYLDKLPPDTVVTFQSFLNHKNWKIFYQPGQYWGKATALLTGYAKRILCLFSCNTYDYVFVHREVTPAGPPIFEWIISKLLRKKIIYDFDDAIWLTDKRNESVFEKTLRWRSKVGSICKWSYKVSCGNEYLCNYARQFNQQVVYNPSTIDTQNVHNPELHQKSDGESLIIGWTGSHSTLKYLNGVTNAINQIERKYPSVRFLVIADRNPDLNIRSKIFTPWSAATEITDLNRIDIGIMPLPDDEWSKGKCGFKILQYMALEIPSLASPVGVNTDIVTTGVNGFLCSTSDDWISNLENLIQQPELRKSIGKKGRLTVEQRFSVVSNSANFLALFT